MSLSPARAVFGLVPHAEPFGVVGGHRSREHELRVLHLLAHDPERVDHADRVLPRVEAAHLAHDRPVDVDAVLAHQLVAERQREVEVLHRERIDARRRVHDAVHVERRGHELGHRPHRRVVDLDERPEELPHLRVGVGEVDVAAPDPLRVGHRATEALAQEAQHRGGLRVVDHDEVVVTVEQQRVVEHLLEVGALHLRSSTRCRRPATRCGPPW